MQSRIQNLNLDPTESTTSVVRIQKSLAAPSANFKIVKLYTDHFKVNPLRYAPAFIEIPFLSHGANGTLWGYKKIEFGSKKCHLTAPWPQHLLYHYYVWRFALPCPTSRPRTLCQPTRCNQSHTVATVMPYFCYFILGNFIGW